MSGALHPTQLSRRTALGALLTGVAVSAISPTRAWARAEYMIPPDIIVAWDGSGHFKSIHEALQSIPKSNLQRIIIFVKNGIYDEVTRIDAPYVTLRGQSRLGTRLQANRPATPETEDKLGQAVLNIGPAAHDFVLENMTVHNTVSKAGPHAFAIKGRADRTIVQNADILSLGADTLSLWRTKKSREEDGLSEAPGATPLVQNGGRYYHTGLRVTGAVDFICPRGWCYMSDSEVIEVFDGATAALWHDGSGVEDKKFVIKNCTIDGPPGFELARHHHDAQFYFIGCRISERVRDKAPYFVRYPIGGGTPKAEDIANNQRLDAERKWGERVYFYNTLGKTGNHSWMADNLDTAPSSPNPNEISARWTFANSWDPERSGPRVTAVAFGKSGIELTFDRLVTVKGTPELELSDGSRSAVQQGSGTNVLVFEKLKARPGAKPKRLLFDRGAIIDSEAIATLAFAEADIIR